MGAWSDFKDWMGRRADGVREDLNDAAEVVQVVVVPQARAIADGEFFGNPHNNPKYAYVPPVYEENARLANQPAAATQEGRDKQLRGIKEANVRVAKATEGYQDAAVGIATLPTLLLPIAPAGTALTKGVLVKGGLKIFGVSFLSATGANETFHAASPGPRPFHEVKNAQQELAKTIMIQATTEKVNTALKKLAKDGKQFALADLDRDSDGVFTAADVTKIKEAVGDEVVAKELFEELRKFGITFENQKVSEVIKKLQDEATKGQRVGVVTSNKPSGESPGFFGRIWAAIVEIFNKITGFFTGSKTSETPPTTQRAQASSASADRVIVSGQLSPPAFPMGAGIGRENEIRLG